jgi:hypothetical protein
MTDPLLLGQKIPVKRLEMSEVENRPVALRDRSIMEGSGLNQTGQGIGGCASLKQYLR